MAKALDFDQKDASISKHPLEKVVDNPQPSSSLIIEDLQIGVRKFRVAHSRASAFSGLFNARTFVVEQLPIIVRLATDIFRVSPHYTLVFLLWKLWSSINETLEMYLWNRLLQLVCLTIIDKGSIESMLSFDQVGVYLATRQLQATQIFGFGIARGFVAVLSNYFEWHG